MPNTFRSYVKTAYVKSEIFWIWLQYLSPVFSIMALTNINSSNYWCVCGVEEAAAEPMKTVAFVFLSRLHSKTIFFTSPDACE